MLDHLHFARKLTFVCGLSTAVISAHAAAYAANASVAGSASVNTGGNVNGNMPVPAPIQGTAPNQTNTVPPSTINATPPNAINAAPPNANNGMPANMPNATKPTTVPNGVATNWNAEDQYWRNNFPNRPYAHDNVNYTMYRPAFQFGVNAYSQYGGRPFNDINQDQLRASWQKANPNSALTWDQAELAIRDSYDRLYDRRVNGQ